MLPSHDHEVLLGDLAEEYAHGRSTTWYCCQVLVAMVVGSWRDIGRHPMLAVRAVGVGIVTLFLIFAPASGLPSLTLPLWILVGGCSASRRREGDINGRRNPSGVFVSSWFLLISLY